MVGRDDDWCVSRNVLETLDPRSPKHPDQGTKKDLLQEPIEHDVTRLPTDAAVGAPGPHYPARARGTTILTSDFAPRLVAYQSRVTHTLRNREIRRTRVSEERTMTSIMPGAEPFGFEGQGSETGVLLIHG